METLYTVGYAGMDREKLFAWLRANDAILADVRYAPWSKDPLWHTTSLRVQLNADGRGTYHWVRELGNLNYKGLDGDAVVLAKPELGKAKVLTWLQTRPVVLMCGCPLWISCHRKDAADLFRNDGVNVYHLTRLDIVGPPPPPPPPDQMSLL